MHKPHSLRTHLTRSIAELKQNPDKLLIFADEGKLVASGTNSLSFEYRYQLTVIVTDYGGDANKLMVCLMAWVAQHQPDLLTNAERRQPGIRFEVDFINHAAADYSIKIDLTERVIVKQDKHGKTEITYPPEPPSTDNFWYE